MAGYQLDIKLEGFEEFKRKLEEAPQIIAEAKFQIMDKIVTVGRQEAFLKAPHHQGYLRSDIAKRSKVKTFSGDFVGVIMTDIRSKNGFPYGIAQEYGTKPFFPNYKSKEFQNWCRIHNIPLFLAARAIAKRGIKGKFFMKAATEKIKNSISHILNEAMKSLVKKLSFRI